ncbi:MAG: DUF2849 domain-containing protein [Pseudomonadota bacterium]|jgi:hypothetical protein|nr:DUF2849 domain-containing protein [Pseudomonadota bacterium]MEC8578142.1 DUF2849 domain-containing protein [Pseudomonadota bacterium]
MKNGIIGSNSEKFFMAQHSSKGARFQAVTANRLLDGEVVYLAADNSWTEVFSEAEIADGPEAGEALLARAVPDGFEKQVLEPYLFEAIEDENTGFRPVSVREIIRAKGPTVRLDLGKQASRQAQG